MFWESIDRTKTRCTLVSLPILPLPRLLTISVLIVKQNCGLLSNKRRPTSEENAKWKWRHLLKTFPATKHRARPSVVKLLRRFQKIIFMPSALPFPYTLISRLPERLREGTSHPPQDNDLNLTGNCRAFPSRA